MIPIDDFKGNPFALTPNTTLRRRDDAGFFIRAKPLQSIAALPPVIT
jgi:hypothetical protein